MADRSCVKNNVQTPSSGLPSASKNVKCSCDKKNKFDDSVICVDDELVNDVIYVDDDVDADVIYVKTVLPEGTKKNVAANGAKTVVPKVADETIAKKVVRKKRKNKRKLGDEVTQVTKSIPSLFNNHLHFYKANAQCSSVGLIVNAPLVPIPETIHIPPLLCPSRLTFNCLRPIAIDGSNVAFCHGERYTRPKVFSCLGIFLAVDYFLKRGHKTVKAFVPQFRRSKSNEVVGIEILEKLGRTQHVVFTPSRSIDGRLIVCYDDRFVLEYAERSGAVVVSNDRFRDLMNESLAWGDIIRNRLLMYSFVDDFFIVPGDPLGKNGPTLNQFLSF